MANKRPVITATILQITTVRNMNNSDQNIHIAKIMVERKGENQLIQVKMRFEKEEYGEKLRVAIEGLLEKQE